MFVSATTLPHDPIGSSPNARLIATAGALLASLLLKACVFLPEVVEERENSCQLYTKQLRLEFAHADFSGVTCSGEACTAVLTAMLVISATTLVVSGSIVVVGNTIHWIEQSVSCDAETVQRHLNAPTELASSSQQFTVVHKL